MRTYATLIILFLVQLATLAQKPQKIAFTSMKGFYIGIDMPYYNGHLNDSLTKWFGEAKAAAIIENVEAGHWPKKGLGVAFTYDTTIIGNFARELNCWKIAAIEKKHAILEVRPEDNKHLNDESFTKPFYIFIKESDGISIVKKWKNASTDVVDNTKVSDVPFKKENKEIVSVNKDKKEPELSEAKIKAIIKATVKSKMVPGDKIMLDTTLEMDPLYPSSNQKIIHTWYDEINYNRTLYAAVKETDAPLDISSLYSFHYVILPNNSTKEFTISGHKLYRISFTGPITGFNITHHPESSGKIYVFLTKRLDEKGLAANKEVIDEWEEGFTNKNAELQKKRKEREKQNSGFSTVASEIKSRMKALYESAKLNNAKLHSSPRPSLTEMNRIIKDVDSKYKDLKTYLINNESQIKSFAASNSSNSAYMKKISESIMEISRNFKRIDDTIKASNESGGNIIIGNLWAAFIGIQESAYRTSELNY